MVIKYVDNFLDEKLINDILDEVGSLTWEKHFIRAGSDMKEANDRNTLPVLNRLCNMFSSPIFLENLERMLNIKGIVFDPYLIGAGYSQIKDCGDLKPHIDFNWNDRIKLYRVASFIIYLNTPNDGGEIEFIGFNKIKVKKNRAIIFEHSETIRHFVHPVVGVRNAVRFFYYSSNLSDPETKHRSLYGVENNKYVDIP